MKFTFGLWTVGNVGRDPFGGPTREPLDAAQICDLLGEVGAYGVNFHDNDLIPIDADADARPTQIKKDFKQGHEGQRPGRARWRRRTCSATRSSRTARSPATTPRVRAYAIQKTMRAMDLGAEFGAKIYVFWGGREGAETDATKNPVDAIKRFREAINFLCEYCIEQKYGYKFAFEAKPNEPRGHMYFAVTGSYLALIPTLDHPEMCGVNPEVAHEHMAGLNFVHHVAAGAGDEEAVPHRPERPGVRPLRPGLPLRLRRTYKHAFFLVKLLEDYGYNGPRHFDGHALPPERLRGREGVRPRVHADVHDPEGEGRSAGTPTRRSRGCCKEINVQDAEPVEADEEVTAAATRRSCWPRRSTASSSPRPGCRTSSWIS